MAKCIIYLFIITYSLHTESLINLIIFFLDGFSPFSRKCFQEISLQASFEFLLVEAVYKAFLDPYWVTNVVSLKPYHY